MFDHTKEVLTYPIAEGVNRLAFMYQGRKNLSFILLFALSLSVAFQIPAVSAATRVGTKCTKVHSVVMSGGSLLACEKVKNKLIWKTASSAQIRQYILKKMAELAISPTPTPTLKPTPTPTPTLKPTPTPTPTPTLKPTPMPTLKPTPTPTPTLKPTPTPTPTLKPTPTPTPTYSPVATSTITVSIGSDLTVTYLSPINWGGLPVSDNPIMKFPVILKSNVDANIIRVLVQHDTGVENIVIDGSWDWQYVKAGMTKVLDLSIWLRTIKGERDKGYSGGYNFRVFLAYADSSRAQGELKIPISFVLPTQ
jgi:hypothetical protein